MRKLLTLSLEEVVNFIDWGYFFKAWGLNARPDIEGVSCGCEECRRKWVLKQRGVMSTEKAEEIFKLYLDARDMLREERDRGEWQVQAVVSICKARSGDDEIIVEREGGGELVLPMLRQQRASEVANCCVCMSDFIRSDGDEIGFFCITMKGAEESAKRWKEQGDMYRELMARMLGDRLVEAGSELLHYKVRSEIWGYEKSDVYRKDYTGIRPAVGYPMMPDQSLIFEIDKMLNVAEIGVSFTENGAMSPTSSECGIYIRHPKSFYFMVGDIGEDQLAIYSRKRGKSMEEMRKWVVRVKHNEG